MFEKTDEALVKQALKGKKNAWVSLVKRHEKGIYNYALRMVSNRDDALDMLQDIFLAAFRSLASFRGESPFKGWLFRIAHYRCMEFYRKKRPMQSLDDAPEQVDEDVDICPETKMSNFQQTTEITHAMKNLSFNQRIVVELKFFQQCTFDDIAHQLGISVNTAKSRLYSALDKLKVFMEAENA